MPIKTAAGRKNRRVIKSKRWEQIEKGFDRIEKAHEELAAQHRETEKALKEAQRIVGDLGNRFGDLAEQMLVPALIGKFEPFGFVFRELGRNVKWKSKEYHFSMEFDALLNNDRQVMVVEVKAKLDKDNVDEQLVRMDKIRRYTDLLGDQRQYYGAIAALTAPAWIIKYTLAKGFFLIMPSGEDASVTKPVPEPRVWQPAAWAQGTADYTDEKDGQ